jgi:hypothetical protein
MRINLKSFFIVLLLGIALEAMANNNEDKNIKFKVGSFEYTKEQFNALSKETLKKSSALDFESARAALDNIKTGDSKSILKNYELDVIRNRNFLLFHIQNDLRTLAYFNELPSFEETSSYKNAVKEFQSAIGSNPTGELLGWEIDKLLELSTPFQETNIDFTSNRYKFFHSIDELSASGAWSKDENNEQNGIPNSVEITCHKTTGTCNELYIAINATYGMPPNSHYIDASNNYYKIETWGKNVIVAVDDSPRCYVKTLIINLKTEKVFLKSTTKKLSGKLANSCSSESKQLLEIGHNPDSLGNSMILKDYSKVYVSMGIKSVESRRNAMAPKYKELFKQAQGLSN